MMTTIFVKQAGLTAAESFGERQDQVAVPTGTDVRVRINAISVNPVDYKIRRYRELAEGVPAILGWDAVGIIDAMGEQVEGFQVGDRVWYAGDLLRDGTNQAMQLVDYRLIAKAPASLTDVQAAALPLVTITAWELLFGRLGLQHSLDGSTHRDQRLLVVGAGGGVGSMLVRLAKQLTGITVVGTASHEESRAAILEAGADQVVDHSGSLRQAAADAGMKEFTHIVALAGSDQHFTDYPALLTPYGQLAMIDDPSQPLDLRPLKMKSISFHWEMMFTASYFRDDAAMRAQGRLLAEVASLIDGGRLSAVPTTPLGIFSRDSLAQAHDRLERGGVVGKLVLTMG